MIVAAVHGVGSGRKRFAFASAVGRVSGCLAVNDVGGDGQHALGMRRIAIGRMFANFLHKLGDDVGSNTVDAVVIVAELRHGIFGLVFIVDNETRIVANDVNF